MSCLEIMSCLETDEKLVKFLSLTEQHTQLFSASNVITLGI